MTEPRLVGEDREEECRAGPEVVRVLRGASLVVRPGEIVALVGASGVGRSTLLHPLGALERAPAGRVFFRGEELFARGEAGLVRYRRQDGGFVFQFYNLLGELSALENSMIPALLLRKPSAQARELAATALAEVGLADRMHRRPGELSGGEQQRVAIARALVNGPALILADEPTGNLDPKTSEIIYDLFARLQAERGIAFLVATHNPDLARRADRGYRLAEGRGPAVGTGGGGRAAWRRAAICAQNSRRLGHFSLRVR